MFKRVKDIKSQTGKLQQSTINDQVSYLENLLKNYSKLTIDEPVQVLNDEILQHISKNIDYGILEALNGIWVSYNANYNSALNRISLGSGIHTTIMPSPGTSQGNIPGKFTYVCEEYIEMLKFELVPGGVRNRGGSNELFCGAMKYEQSIKSVNKKNNTTEIIYTGIHEENGMYLWLSNVFNNPATNDSIENDRGIHAYSTEDQSNYGYHGKYRNEPLVKVKNDDGSFSYILLSKLKEEQKYYEIIPAQEIAPNHGINGPYFIPEYSISRSGVIPHGSTITLLGDIVSINNQLLVHGSPQFPKGVQTWQPQHLAISPTMGGAGVSESNPINLDEPAPTWVHEELNDQNDPGSNKIYTQRILAHPLYPYSVRPDLRLRDTLSEQKVSNFVNIHLTSRMKTGSQGGILNIPFVNRFVPTVEVDFNLWIETIIENGKEILQLQYEQIINFEFHFGNDGGVTSWPHIQVNTLRKIEDIPFDQQEIIKKQFFNV